MPHRSLDATILLETPPKFEIKDGLVYITDQIGGLVIRRVMRPNTFLKSLKTSERLIRTWMAGQTGATPIKARGH